MDRRMVALVVLGFAIAGCGSQGDGGKVWQAPALQLAVRPGIYVGTDYNSATMINVSKNPDGTLTGTLTTKQVGDNVVTISGPMSVSGSQFTFSFTQLGTQTSLQGTVQSGDLHMQVPQPDGTVEDYVLKPGTVIEYNADVVHLGTL